MQKEQLSALMDGETLDSELLNELAHNPEMQKTWENYHLIRDSMRGDTPEVLHFDISSRVMAAIEEEPVRQPATLIPEAQPAPHQWQKKRFACGTAYPNGRSRMRIACSYRWRPAL